MTCSNCKMTGHNRRTCLRVNDTLSKNTKIKKRKNSDYPWSEFVVYIILTSHINNYKIKDKYDVIDYFTKQSILFTSINGTSNYLNNLKLEKSSVVDSYIMNFYKSFRYSADTQLFEEFESYNNICNKVYLTGKSITCLKEVNNELFMELSKQNKKERKSDIYIVMKKGEFVGISLKQNKRCQYTNWSIDSIMSCVCDDGDKTNLYDIRKHVLDTISPKEDRKKLTNAEKRVLTKTLMYENDQRMNEYKNILNFYIVNKYSKLFTDKIIEGISQTNNLSYLMYTFDGDTLVDTKQFRDKLNSSHVRFIRDDPNFSVEKYGVRSHYSKTAAKMWYYVQLNNEIKYRFEIRSKGNWDNSPQLLIYKV